MQPKPLTIRDVAAMAGVSQGTVSKVLNEAPGVGAETRARILRLIQDLDYHPNASAQSLVARRTGSIGVIIPHTGGYSMSTAYWPILLTSITDTAADRNLNVLLSTARSEEDTDSAYRSILRGRRVDGVIVGAEQFGQKQLAELLLKGFPFVMVGKNPLVSHWHVDVDNAGGAHGMTRHLIDLGHRSIVMVAGPGPPCAAIERAEGYRRAMAEAGLTPEAVHCAYSSVEASSCVRGILSRRPRPTALFLAAADLASAAIRAVSELKVGVPSDVALVAFDDHPFYEYLSPAITAVSQPIHELGQAALDMLFTLMDGREPEARGRVLPTHLVIRRSCGAGASSTAVGGAAPESTEAS
jgi:DNA-binding LacI/PurR family transcriptional regulator